MSGAQITCQHIRDLDDEALQHTRCPEVLIIIFVQSAVTPPDGKSGEGEIEQHQWMEPKLEDTRPIRRGRLTGINVEEDTEENDLNENGKYEFGHETFVFATWAGRAVKR